MESLVGRPARTNERVFEVMFPSGGGGGGGGGEGEGECEGGSETFELLTLRKFLESAALHTVERLSLFAPNIGAVPR